MVKNPGGTCRLPSLLENTLDLFLGRIEICGREVHTVIVKDELGESWKVRSIDCIDIPEPSREVDGAPNGNHLVDDRRWKFRRRLSPPDSRILREVTVVGTVVFNRKRSKSSAFGKLQSEVTT